MLWIIAFNAILLLLGAGIVKGLVPIKFLRGLIDGLHATIGISTPTERQTRWVIAFWIAFLLVMVDGMLLLFRYAF
jgi:hypothetical protein